MKYLTQSENKNDKGNEKNKKILLIITIILIVFFVYITLSFFENYQRKEVFKGDWIIIKLDQDSISVYNDLLSTNCLIDLNSNLIHWPSFIDSDLKINKSLQKIDVKILEGEIFIISNDYDIFKDTFFIKCLDNECCQISLSSSSLYMELIYNGNFEGIGRSKKCPRADKVIEKFQLFR